jgi:PAS domain S-box-containing protein
LLNNMTNKSDIPYKQEHPYRSFIENIRDAALCLDPDGNIEYANEAVCTLLGYSRQEFLTLRFYDLDKTHAIEEVMRLWIKDKNRRTFITETLLRDKNNLSIAVEISFAYIVIDNNGTGCILAILRDKSAIITQNNALISILNSSEHTIALLDRRGKIVIINEAGAARFDSTPDEMMGKNVYTLLPPDLTQARKALIDTVFETGESINFKDSRDGKDYSNSVYPIYNQNINNTIEYVTIFSADITERKYAIRETRDQQLKLQGVIESTNDAIFSIDIDFRYTCFNQRHAAIMKEFYGVEIELGQTLLDYILNEEDLIRSKTNLERALRGESFIEERILGEEALWPQYFEITHNPIKDSEGHILGVAVFARDITIRKGAQNSLLISKELYRNLVENINDVIYKISAEGQIIFVSHMVQKILGYDPSELIGKNYMSLVYSDDYEIIQKAFEDLLKGTLYPSEFRMLKKSGDICWVRTFSRPVYDDRMIISIQGVLSDITEHKQMEENLRKKTEIIAAAFQSAPNGIIMIDIRLKIFDCNEEALRMFAYSGKDELIGKSFFELVIPEQQKKVKNLINDILNIGIIKNAEYTLINKAGQKFPGELSGVVLPGVMSNPSTLMIIINDISTLVEAHKELLDANESLILDRRTLAEKNIALGEILNQVEKNRKQIAQQIQSNINKVIAPLLNKISGKVDPKFKRDLDKIKSNLNEITSPFVRSLEIKFSGLTPREIEICKMIKEGLSSKEIAESLNISVETIRNHRKNIRKKLGLANKKTNLIAFLDKH